jgi:hypothetical protein
MDDPIHEMWISDRCEERGMAHVFVVRERFSSLNIAGYLIDNWGFGLKDAYVMTGTSRRRFQEYLLKGGEMGITVAQTDLETVQQWVHGGILWAQKWGFRTPKAALQRARLVPPPTTPPDLDRFGKNGKPLLVLQPGNLARFMPGVSLQDLPGRGIDFLVASAETPPSFLGKLEENTGE